MHCFKSLRLWLLVIAAIENSYTLPLCGGYQTRPHTLWCLFNLTPDKRDFPYGLSQWPWLSTSPDHCKEARRGCFPPTRASGSWLSWAFSRFPDSWARTLPNGYCLPPLASEPAMGLLFFHFSSLIYSCALGVYSTLS